MKKTISVILTVTSLMIANAQDGQMEKNSFPLEINSSFSYKMMEPNEDLRKVFVFVKEREENNLGEKQMIIGSSLIALGDYQVSNTDSKFGYLMRHPTANNQIGKEVSEAVIHSFQLSFPGTVNNWLGALTSQY